ncbi:MAG: flagellar assembly protein FliW [Candidatus Neomarinimicrobiota bacterium]
MTEKPANKQSQPEWTAFSEPAHFPAGIPGFEDHKNFQLVTRSDLRPFLWLRSLDDPEVSLPVIDCLLLKKPLLPEINREVLNQIGDPATEKFDAYYVLRVDSTAGTITVNTKAPVVISADTRRGYQVFMDHPDLRMDEPLANLVPTQKDP